MKMANNYRVEIFLDQAPVQLGEGERIIEANKPWTACARALAGALKAHKPRHRVKQYTVRLTKI